MKSAIKGLIKLLETPGQVALVVVVGILISWVIGVFHGDDLMEKYRLGENIGAVVVGAFLGWLISRKSGK